MRPLGRRLPGLLGAALCLVLCLANGSALAAGRVFLFASGGTGCVLLNRFPVSYGFDRKEFSVTSQVPPITVRKGRNEVEAVLGFEAGSGAQFIVGLAEIGEEADRRYTIEMQAPDGEGQQAGRYIYGPKKEDGHDFVLPANHEGLVQPGADPPVTVKKVTGDGKTRRIMIQFSFKSATGIEGELPWVKGPPPGKVDVKALDAFTQRYLDCLKSKDAPALTTIMKTKWSLEERAGGMAMATRVAGVKAQFARKQPIQTFGTVKTYTSFPGSPVILVEQQVGMIRQGRRAFQKLYMYKDQQSWVILR